MNNSDLAETKSARQQALSPSEPAVSDSDILSKNNVRFDEIFRVMAIV